MTTGWLDLYEPHKQPNNNQYNQMMTTREDAEKSHQE